MKTLMLRTMQQPSHIEGLLKSLVKSMDIIPPDAELADDSSDLPSSVQKVVMAAEKAGKSWRCWMDRGLRVWLFVAEMSLPLSRERGSPVLRVHYHRESGLKESGNWVIDRQAKWQRCAQ